MSFVMIATGGAGGGRVRTLSSRRLALAVLGCAAVLLGAGAGLGYLVARQTAPAVPAMTAAAPPPRVSFALEHLGALSARLFRLESEAAQLSRRLPMTGAAPASAPGAASAASAAAGRGGPMLPPRAAAELPEDFLEWQQRLQRLEQQLARVADASAEAGLQRLRLPRQRPVADGDVVSVYGNRADPFTQRRAFHAGLDFAADAGTPIVAAGGGRVSFAGYRSDYGWTVEIDHGNGLATRYAHASRLLVRPQAVVAPGDRIALVGSTGRSTGPHLHFEVLHRGETVDPRRYLDRP